MSFYGPSGIRVGVWRDNGIVDVTQGRDRPTFPASIMDVIAMDGHDVEAIRSFVEAATEFLSPDDVRFAPAVQRPSKILCVGLNYRRHAEETGMPIPEYPIYFSKFPNSLAASGETVTIPGNAREIDFEVELVAIVGRKAKQVSVEVALQYVFGYATGNDLSARDLQFRTGQWLYGKAIDGFSPLGPCIVTADEVGDPQNLGLKLWHNGQLMQDSNTGDMIFSVAEVISDLSQIMTLEPGDLIYTGTPEGVIMGRSEKRWIAAGDEVVCEVSGLGRLVNRFQ
ncbi:MULTISPECIES: fumarylacetoacetate hydrolase family protein [Alicyclobacillus]|uniref:fumarylacetoacetate hydrolase family protein n=1 Tax=Alicyclobacillus TaxID=29330 RepID=UPI002ADE9003|nr:MULTISPECIES: fumarylacetoacetate hydrolase family protein [Alicyclobacillus]